MTYDIAGKTALITGANSGIGRACAQLLADHGVSLALTARAAGRLNDVVSTLGRNAIGITADLSRPADVERLMVAATTHFGHIDILLANAGTYLQGPVVDNDPNAWDSLIAVNVSGTFRLVQAALRLMIPHGDGDIVVTSSVSGYQAIPWEPVYSASKHAITAFVHGVRQQVANTGVRLGCIAPGIVMTELWGDLLKASKHELISTRGALFPEDVADTVLYMLTRPRHVTLRDVVILPSGQSI